MFFRFGQPSQKALFLFLFRQVQIELEDLGGVAHQALFKAVDIVKAQLPDVLSGLAGREALGVEKLCGCTRTIKTSS